MKVGSRCFLYVRILGMWNGIIESQNSAVWICIGDRSRISDVSSRALLRVRVWMTVNNRSIHSWRLPLVLLSGLSMELGEIRWSVANVKSRVYRIFHRGESLRWHIHVAVVRNDLGTLDVVLSWFQRWTLPSPNKIERGDKLLLEVEILFQSMRYDVSASLTFLFRVYLQISSCC